jgi:hypothetical protein
VGLVTKLLETLHVTDQKVSASAQPSVPNSETHNMSERGAFRGGRGGARGGDRGGRGGGRGGAQSGGAAAQTERPKKENILDLSKYMDKQINVKFSGGREGKHCAGAWGEWVGKVRVASWTRCLRSGSDTC